MVGDTAMSLVAGIWVKSLTGSSAMAGLVSACVYLPSLFGPAGGMVADRFPRRRLLLGLPSRSSDGELDQVERLGDDGDAGGDDGTADR